MCDASIVQAPLNFAKDVGKVATDVVGGVVEPLADVTDSVIDYTAEKIENTIKDVTGYTAAEDKAQEEFKRAKAEADRIAKERQDELNRLAAVREQQAADQQARMTELLEKQTAAETAQQAKVDQLQAQQATQLAQLEKEQLATTAAGASLRVLAKQKTGQAPTAQLSGRRKSKSTAYRSPTSKLSVGSSGRDAGVGVNFGG
tara:strand:- start:90 stop:695 length:606 start_codon:yes stop_codon:yes gene_type:complete